MEKILLDFIKWMGTLSEEERCQNMQTLQDMFAPSPTHTDFKRLKGALKRSENRVKQLENKLQGLNSSPFEQLYKSLCHSPEYNDIRKRIIAAQLYRNLAKQNRELLRHNRTLQADVAALICKLHQGESK